MGIVQWTTPKGNRCQVIVDRAAVIFQLQLSLQRKASFRDEPGAFILKDKTRGSAAYIKDS